MIDFMLKKIDRIARKLGINVGFHTGVGKCAQGKELVVGIGSTTLAFSVDPNDDIPAREQTKYAFSFERDESTVRVYDITTTKWTSKVVGGSYDPNTGVTSRIFHALIVW